MKLLIINIYKIFIGLVLLTIFPFYSYANITYVSLHEIESIEHQQLSLTLNIVEEAPTLPVKFVLQSQKTRTPLSFQRLNKYMLRLTSPNLLIGKGAVHVYQLEGDAWRLIKRVKISNELIPLKLASKAHLNTQKILNTNIAKSVTTKSNTNKVATKNQTHCILSKQPKETLWAIASRYKTPWNVDIYSAMIAIYRSNLTHFSQQHIGQLINEVTLTCPSNELIKSMGTKEEMKAEFTRLNAR